MIGNTGMSSAMNVGGLFLLMAAVITAFWLMMQQGRDEGDGNDEPDDKE